MSKSSSSNDNTENRVQEDSTATSSKVSEELLEQVNHRMLKMMHETILTIQNTVTTQAPTSDAPLKKEGYMRIDFSSIIKGLIIVFPILVSIVAATAWVTSTIDSRVKDSHQDLKQDMQLMKQELSGQNKETQSSLMRLSDRNDTQFDKINDKLDRIAQKIDENKSTN